MEGSSPVLSSFLKAVMKSSNSAYTLRVLLRITCNEIASRPTGTLTVSHKMHKDSLGQSGHTKSELDTIQTLQIIYTWRLKQNQRSWTKEQILNHTGNVMAHSEPATVNTQNHHIDVAYVHTHTLTEKNTSTLPAAGRWVHFDFATPLNNGGWAHTATHPRNWN